MALSMVKRFCRQSFLTGNMPICGIKEHSVRTGEHITKVRLLQMRKVRNKRLPMQSSTSKICGGYFIADTCVKE